MPGREAYGIGRGGVEGVRSEIPLTSATWDNVVGGGRIGEITTLVRLATWASLLASFCLSEKRIAMTRRVSTARGRRQLKDVTEFCSTDMKKSDCLGRQNVSTGPSLVGATDQTEAQVKLQSGLVVMNGGVNFPVNS
ncbi:unnamed protein product [Protopolystoma xenopodis]|uniref:Uncharacterized protein n=1 Tax=Protopolystoma xenopodis TaxID=117903 RepID=A0A3S5C3S1_9PLAT|nr:unnamed protein product [Protopolystoma xenopodis]